MVPGAPAPMDGVIPLHFSGLDIEARIDPPGSLGGQADENMAGWRAFFEPLPGGDSRWLRLGLGPDLATGYALAEILRPFLCAAVRIARACGQRGMGWVPARLFSALSLWDEQLELFERHELLPVVPLVAFDDGPNLVSTRGLDQLAGEELLIEAPMLTRQQLVRRMLRLAVDRYRDGPFEHDALLPDIEPDMAWRVVAGAGITRFRVEATPS